MKTTQYTKYAPLLVHRSRETTVYIQIYCTAYKHPNAPLMLCHCLGKCNKLKMGIKYIHSSSRIDKIVGFDYLLNIDLVALTPVEWAPLL